MTNKVYAHRKSELLRRENGFKKCRNEPQKEWYPKVDTSQTEVRGT